MKTIEVLFTPAESNGLPQQDLSRTACVVFDILRATSTIVTALANGATAVVPVLEISEAVALRQARPEVLLAGERDGVRIRASQSGGMDFDLGNSPREFTATVVAGKTIVTTTTNGTMALRACASARHTLVGSFLNLQATVATAVRLDCERFLVVCSGTGQGAAMEDTLAAGALCDLLQHGGGFQLGDSAQISREVFLRHQGDLIGAMKLASNGCRLLSMPDLREDVAFCLRRDVRGFAARLDESGAVKRLA